MQHRTLIAAGLLAVAGLTSAHAVTVAVSPGGGWQEFVVDDPQFSIAGSDLAWHDPEGNGDIFFTFTIAAGQIGTLTVVDAGFAGDRFHVVSNGVALADTAAAVNSYPIATAVLDDALADTNFSRGIYAFSAGSYTITGSLAVSALDDASAALNSTNGALELEVAAVPEAPTLSLLMAGLGVVGLLARRRAR
jgi:hypothetical protein